MRTAVIVVVVLAAMGGAAFWASKRLVVEQVPPTPPATWTVKLAAPGLSADKLELEAIPLEAALAKVTGVTRTRTRAQMGSAAIEVWGPENADLATAVGGVKLGRFVEAPVVFRTGRPPTYWLLRGGPQRPSVDGEICGREALSANVYIDPLKLDAFHLTALNVDRALKKPDVPEELDKLEISDAVRLSDVARVESAPAPARCVVSTPEGEAWFVTSRQQELGGGAVAVEKPSRIELRLEGEVPLEKLVPPSVAPKVTTVVPWSSATLWFSPALTPPQRAKVVEELRAVPGVQVSHVDGLPRVRVVVSSQYRTDLDGIAHTLVESLKRAKGVELVVPPLKEAPQLEVKLDTQRAEKLDVKVEDVEDVVRLAREGHRHDGFFVKVQLEQREHLGALMVRDRRLSELVIFSEQPKPQELMRENGRPATEIVAYGIDRKGVTVPSLPAGVKVEIHEEL